MWPNVDLEKREISGFAFELEYFSDEWKDPNVKIEEIVMIFANFHAISFPKSDVVCSVSYDTDFGIHTILFSKVPQLDFTINGGFNWFSIYSTNLSPKFIRTEFINDGPEEHIASEILTDLYKNTVKNFTESDVKREPTPEDIERIKKILEGI